VSGLGTSSGKGVVHRCQRGPYRTTMAPPSLALASSPGSGSVVTQCHWCGPC
jgi:hypothetical protein